MINLRRLIFPLLVLLVAGGLHLLSPERVTISGPTMASWSADTLEVGQEARITVGLDVGAAGLPEGTELRVGFPHWVYGSRDVRAPEGATSGQYGHWYVTERLPTLAPGVHHELSLSPMRLPQTYGDFAPLVFLDWVPVSGLTPVLLEKGEPERLVVIAPSVVVLGSTVWVKGRLEDRFGNAIAIQQTGVTAPEEPGIHRLPYEVNHRGPWSGVSQPVLVQDAEETPLTVAWLDLHGHSELSDGRGSPEAWYAAAQGSLDGAALSDHDWQLTDGEWAEMLAATEVANRPAEGFITLPAVEINVQGHEIAYFADAARLAALPHKGSRDGARTIWEETDRGQPTAKVPDLLAAYGTGSADLLVATHTSLAAHMGTGFPLPSPLPGNGAFEIYSAHGSSECRDCARQVEGGDLDEGERVGSLWDALDAGMGFTLIAAGDGHDGRPGSPNWGAWPGGLTAVEVEELTRESVFEALQEGRAWATTGERTVLRARWRADGVDVLVVGEDVEAVEVIGDRRIVARVDAPVPGEWTTIDGLEPTEWRYVRALLPDGARAWRGVWRASATAAE